MSNEELKQRTIVALARAAISPMVSDEDLQLLCWHCGVQVGELQGVKVSGYRMGDLKEFVPPSKIVRDLMDRIVEEH